MEHPRNRGLTEKGQKEARHYDRTLAMFRFAEALATGVYPNTPGDADGIMNRATLLADAYLRKRDELDAEYMKEEVPSEQQQ